MKSITVTLRDNMKFNFEKVRSFYTEGGELKILHGVNNGYAIKLSLVAGIVINYGGELDASDSN